MSTHAPVSPGEILTDGLVNRVNNLATVVLCNAEFLRVCIPDEETFRRGLADMCQAAESLAILAAGLARVSLLQPESTSRWDLNDLVFDIQPETARLVGERIFRTVRCHAASLQVSADREQLARALLAVVALVCAAMPEGGCLTLATSLESDREGSHRRCWGQITVSGTGRMMEGGLRLTGLGLAEAANILERAAGSVTVDHSAGAGTTVTLRLPLSGCLVG